MDRRNFLGHISALTGLMLGGNDVLSKEADKKKVVILRSSWQTENIGDIAHTPGVLALMEKYLPDVEVRLWPSSVGNGVEEMLRKRFPYLRIIKTDADKEEALTQGDFMLHGSGPSLVARNDLNRWRTETGKPYGIYGITFPGVYGFKENRDRFNPLDIELMNHAAFSYFRDSVSYNFAKAHGLTCPVAGFCPDGAFAIDLRNDVAAEKWLNDHDLKTGEFVCVIPQYRFSPWWELKSKNQSVNAQKEAYNAQMKEHDNAPIREAIIAVIEQTSKKVLIVPENETQIRIGKEMLYDPLPADIKKRVVWRDRYWLTDEAISTYARSAGLFGLEMHSPIMCIAIGIPAIVCRFDEQTSKGYMWADIGLKDWLFDMDTPADVARITPTVLKMINQPEEAKQKVEEALKFVKGHQKQTMQVLANTLKI